jgi:sulfur relay (sulfurtransferase) complex TusBCD TusD component (DsrE family)
MSSSILILINDAPYGTEKAYNALRLAKQVYPICNHFSYAFSFFKS